MSKLQSFVNIPSEEMISQCEATLKRIEEAREEEIEKVIADLSRPPKQGFFSRLFRIKPPTPPTREQLLGPLGQPGEIGWEIAYIRKHWYEEQENLANRLIDIAKMSSTVNVTAKDLAILNGRAR